MRRKFGICLSVCMTGGKEARLDFVGWDERSGAWQTRDFNWAERGVLLVLLSAPHAKGLDFLYPVYILISGSSELTMR